MLRELRLRNVAVIEEASLTFATGLTVLTGETGAGKSIVVDALELILGGRGSSELIRSGCDEASVEAAFALAPDAPAVQKLRELDIDAFDELVVRRIISATGRNRIYLNGTIATLATLGEVTRQLIDIHGQHDHQSLLHTDLQLAVLDSFAGIRREVDEYTILYKTYTETQSRLKQLRTLEQERVQRREMLQFQADEISSANPMRGEDTALEEEFLLLANAEKLQRLAEESYDILYSSDPSGGESVLKGLKRIAGNLASLAEYDSSLTENADVSRNCMILAEEVALVLRNYKERINLDPDRLNAVADRLELLKKLKKKYGNTLEDVLARLEEATNDLKAIDSAAAEITSLETEIEGQRRILSEKASKLSKQRKSATTVLKKRVEESLAELGMTGTTFEVYFGAEDASQCQLAATGFDRVEFLISPNPGESLKPLAKIASGGELSRIMLGLKSILAGEDAVPTLIFDEVDAGIGGRVADSVGAKLKDISENHQVMCVTHLAQVASYADHHFHVTKTVADGRTFTSVELLDRKARVEEIARMLGGKEETALKHAGEMLAR